MQWSLMLFVNSVLLGVGLAMDAFSVSLATGLREPKMKLGRMNLIAGVFGGFQAVMPLIGWICVHTLLTYFQAFEKCIPWIAMILLGFIGGKMLYEGIRKKGDDEAPTKMGLHELLIMGVATSIDALSVGFTIAEYQVLQAVVAALIIGVVTYIICMVGLFLGKKFGTRFSSKAQILGGVILIVLGVEIFVKMLR